MVKKFVFNVDYAQTPMSPSGAMSTKAFELQISSQESSKINKYFVPLFFSESMNSKFTPCTNSRFFFAKHCKEVENVNKKSNFRQTLVEMFQF